MTDPTKLKWCCACLLCCLQARTRLNPDSAPKVELAPVLPTAGAYAVFMAASSNTRYQVRSRSTVLSFVASQSCLTDDVRFVVWQVVNSFEGNLLPCLPGGKSVQTVRLLPSNYVAC